MTEPIKPIERNLKDADGQTANLTNTIRARYWKQKAQELPPVDAGEESAELKDNPEPNVAHQETPSLQARQTYAEFEINQETREVFVRIIDADSGKLIRTLPPDKLAEEIAKGNLHPRQLRRKAVFG
ncbi:MAG TPA: flagellar protein FlaG [Anaerolineae bacterium]|nr:flagellar protein FlaG [Anaerolineae bacterium]HMR65609.1 flagellar protein FlaG [Anaerolineae bacterium]